MGKKVLKIEVEAKEREKERERAERRWGDCTDGDLEGQTTTEAE